jgi:transcription elongation factor Elf1
MRRPTLNQKQITCPYCGKKDQSGVDPAAINESQPVICDDCGKEFEITINWSYTFSTFQIDEKDS